MKKNMIYLEQSSMDDPKLLVLLLLLLDLDDMLVFTDCFPMLFSTILQC